MDMDMDMDTVASLTPGRHRAATMLIALAVASCGSPRREIATTVGERDDGTAVVLPPGGTLVLRLPSIAGAGYSWQLENPPSTCVEELSSSLEHTHTGMPGAATASVFRFRVTPGECDVALRYVRPWDRTAVPAKRFRLHVVAR